MEDESRLMLEFIKLGKVYFVILVLIMSVWFETIIFFSLNIIIAQS